MPSTTSYKRGDIVLVSFSFTDLSATKRRPALIISPDSLNQLNEDFILAAITSQLSPDPHGFVIQQSDLSDGALPKKSMVRLSKIFTMHSLLIRKKIGTLRPAKMADVLSQIQALFS